MDTTDRKILNHLLTNARVSATALSSELAISNVATKQRIDKLEQKGIIRGYAADVDTKKLGYHTTAYIGIFLEKAKYYEEVVHKLSAVPQILEAHFTTGNYSIFAKIIARDNEDLMSILSKHVQNIDGVARTETFISLHEGFRKPVRLTDS